MSAEPDFDWFAASCFVPGTARAQVSAQLNDYVAESARYVLDHRVRDVNLYLSGSLARQEPSVARGPDGRYRLHSDVDLVAVTEGEPAPGHPVFALEDHLARRFPEVEVTVLHVARSHLHRVGSLYGRDLWCGLDRPVARTFEIDRPDPPAIGPRQQLEVLVHQLGACLLYRTAADDGERAYLLRESPSVHLLKLALESLRCLLVPPPDGPLRFGDTYVRRDSGAMARLLRGPDVGRLVRYRENHVPDPALDVDVYQWVIESLVILLGAGEGPGTQRRLVTRVEELAVDRTDVMNLFQAALLLFLLATRSTGEADRRRAAHALFDVWSRVEVPGGRSSAAVGQVLRTASPESLAARARGAVAAGRNALADLRLDYYAALKEHNNGRIINPRYAALKDHRGGPGAGPRYTTPRTASQK